MNLAGFKASSAADLGVGWVPTEALILFCKQSLSSTFKHY